jgi:threonylcarbamoyladenosine tRNA methylthiotransferase MtaB
MNIHFKTLGCRLNEAETHQWSRQFKQSGHHITNAAEDADIIVLNSCAVTAEACKKSRQSIRRLKRESPQAKLVISGCFATMEPETARDLEADLVVNNAEKDQLADQVMRFFDLPQHDTIPVPHLLPENHKTRGFIKIQDGCRYHCTYCIVTTLRGEEKSRPPEHIIEEIHHLEQAGIQEIVLTGVHTCGYGHDIDTNLSTLLRDILSQTQIRQNRFNDLEIDCILIHPNKFGS